MQISQKKMYQFLYYIAISNSSKEAKSSSQKFKVLRYDFIQINEPYNKFGKFD